MKELAVIEQREVLGKEFKIYGDYNNPLFLAKDIANWIDHNKPAEMLSHIDEEEKLKAIISHSGQKREMWMLTEDGMYEVLMQSRKPIAKKFKKQVKIILKDIRKYGMYAREELLNNPDLLIEVATELKKQKALNQEQAMRIEADKPKVIFADSVASSETSILVGELSKILKANGVEIGQNRLFKWLRDKGYLIKRKGVDWNMPTQYSMERALFEIKETVVTHADGHITINKTPKVTGKGQVYFVNKFLKER